MEKYQKIFAVIIAIAIISTGVLIYWNQGSENRESIYVYCGAGLREPMDVIGNKFENKTGIRVEYNYAGSNTLLSQIQLNEEGDAYMPGAKYYIDQADKKGFVDNKSLVAYHTPVIVVPEGNPADIHNLTDLADPGVDVALGSPKACAIGRLGKKILNNTGIRDQITENVVTRAGTVNELVVYVSQKQADAGIIWKANLHGTEEETDHVNISQEYNIIKTIPIGSLSFSENKDLAKRFVDYVSSEEGKSIFEDYGFIDYEG